MALVQQMIDPIHQVRGGFRGTLSRPPSYHRPRSRGPPRVVPAPPASRERFPNMIRAYQDGLERFTRFLEDRQIPAVVAAIRSEDPSVGSTPLDVADVGGLYT